MTEYEGVERSKTEQLRKLLDDRGVKWKALSDRQEGDYTITATRWHDDDGNLLTMCISEPDGGTWDFFWYPTPEQAVEATLGCDTCEVDASFRWNRPFCEPYWEHELSCGHTIVLMEPEPPNYCPECGRRVKE